MYPAGNLPALRTRKIQEGLLNGVYSRIPERPIVRLQSQARTVSQFVHIARESLSLIRVSELLSSRSSGGLCHCSRRRLAGWLS